MARAFRRGLLFADVPRGVGPAPIYLAIAALVVVSLVEFVVALWPDDSAASASRSAESRAGPANQSLHGSLCGAPGKSPPPGAMRSI